MILTESQLKRTKKYLVEWIRTKTREAGAEGLVYGLSGGIDSAVVSLLCREALGEKSFGLILPCYSQTEDIEHAKKFALNAGINIKLIDISRTYSALVSDIGIKKENMDLAQANIKARLRMTVLYYFANSLNYLVCGTGNKSELKVGYFTKYGDGGVDLLPLGNLVKTHLIQLGKFMGVPEQIIKKQPSAGLWEGQTDEDELGITYSKLDRYILLGEASEKVKGRIDDRVDSNAHKLSMPEIPDIF